ncbi:BaiN/RdsA family NAD(P)/FAD-dependent oxidoreductase [Marinobacterium weihaiense]|uniref:NAD(P)/FAD-dependent oxidoreductase n=1 Tax=Marinobacterium weihaiense TaxID=2851016 RepID=A0ABS6M653_9GAMM|nr:NAD(P)/FAD-dependent oxidoreductase [Marinobacterium weihaiense]MBV0931756.1 NAD(P)/FAD-dependent oxidoreductase [Marinobacterium weihaiense]
MTYDVVVIGGGASGLMCAATAAYRGRRVLVLEHTKKLGRKILMSGGGRCNFTHMHNTPANFLGANPHFCKSALSRYKPLDFVELVDRHGVEYHEKTPGQLFCNESSKEILQLLLTECDWAGVELMTETSVFSVTQATTGYYIKTSRGQFVAPSVVIATGGLSIPNGGATGFAYEIAEQFGLAVTSRQAALVPFTLQPDLLEHLKPLSGVSQPVSVSCNGMTFSENMLLTHRGLSGPAMLQISSYWCAGDMIEIDLVPQLALDEWLREQRHDRPKAELRTLMAQHMTKRLAQTLCDLWGFEGELGQYSNVRLQEAARQFKRWQIKPSGTEGYRTAEVTLGGIETDEVSQKTFEAKKAPGLYFIGECLDVTGHLGGHNFQWAWASGHCAGQHV